MPHITLTEEQAQAVSQATGSVEVRDPHGQVLAFLKPLQPGEAELIAECERRRAAPGPRYSSTDVLARLRKLQEIDAREKLDPAKARDLIRRMRAGEEV